jgi:hypothetical protein
VQLKAVEPAYTTFSDSGNILKNRVQFKMSLPSGSRINEWVSKVVYDFRLLPVHGNNP